MWPAQPLSRAIDPYTANNDWFRRWSVIFFKVLEDIPRHNRPGRSRASKAHHDWWSNQFVFASTPCIVKHALLDSLGPLRERPPMFRRRSLWYAISKMYLQRGLTFGLKQRNCIMSFGEGSVDGIMEHLSRWWEYM